MLRGPRPRFRPAHIPLHLALIAGGVVMLLPFAWMLSTSLKPPAEVFAYPPIWLPSALAWENYQKAWASMPFGRYYLNSLLVTTSVTVIQLLTASLAAFAFARLRFWGREALFLLYLAALMIPAQVTMIPNFVLVRALGWYDTYQALILPPAFSALSTFLLRQSFRSIPHDLDEAARIDGASSLRIWWSVLLPLIAPALSALAIITALGSWNEFLWPLIVTNSDAVRTLPVGLSAFQGQFKVEWNLLMAGSVIAMLPILALYTAAQRQFIQGVAMTGGR
ncbi:carbohydrate ABC transporter permease [Chloroflexia bacterium SDU3-3]|nr:carbohydrate ABC transporter permease [Chloroflexia bacterium SDU3-3]